jgi:hypothetical protein
MPRAKTSPHPEPAALAVPDGLRFLFDVLKPVLLEAAKNGLQQLLDWLNTKGLDLQAAAREQVRAEVTAQMQAEKPAESQE